MGCSKSSEWCSGEHIPSHATPTAAPSSLPSWADHTHKTGQMQFSGALAQVPWTDTCPSTPYSLCTLYPFPVLKVALSHLFDHITSVVPTCPLPHAHRPLALCPQPDLKAGAQQDLKNPKEWSGKPWVSLTQLKGYICGNTKSAVSAAEKYTEVLSHPPMPSLIQVMLPNMPKALGSIPSTRGKKSNTQKTQHSNFKI